MKSSFAQWAGLWLLAFFLLFSGCKAKPHTAPKAAPQEVKSLPQCPTPVETKDEIFKERADFRNHTRSLYNQRKFADLEALANDLRASKARFGNGSWKILHFYDCLECRKDEPKSMWQLHE